MDMPWTTLGAIEPGREYLVLLSYLPLRTFSKIPGFFRYTFQIQGQLRKTAGAVGYSMRAKLLSRKFWTLSAWESDRALIDFVGRMPHAGTMKTLNPYMGATKFTRWRVPGSALPPKWEDAMRREAKEK